MAGSQKKTSACGGFLPRYSRKGKDNEKIYEKPNYLITRFMSGAVYCRHSSGTGVYRIGHLHYRMLR